MKAIYIIYTGIIKLSSHHPPYVIIFYKFCHLKNWTMHGSWTKLSVLLKTEYNTKWETEQPFRVRAQFSNSKWALLCAEVFAAETQMVT